MFTLHCNYEVVDGAQCFVTLTQDEDIKIYNRCEGKKLD